ncbi:MAG: NAD-binding protein [Synergistaceae bacterium]|nr:NAD-binding protein [Synergistaceae bacterium]
MSVAFIGLGTMGKYMAINMLKCGEPFTVNDIDKSRFPELTSLGAAAVSSIEETAKSDVVFLSLPNTEIVENVIFGGNGLSAYLKKGQAVVDLSTIKYNAALDIGRRLSEKGVDFLDAPVSGMESRAKDGTLTVMCGGDRSVFDRVKKYFDFIGNKILYTGKLGSGQLTKLINQLLFDINAAALAEILPMAVKLGLDCEKVGEVVNSGTGKSYASDFFIPRILKRRFSDGYPMKAAYKDLVSAAEIGANLLIPMPVLAAATATYQTALLNGWGGCDKGGMIQVFEKLLGTEFKEKGTNR